MPLFCNDSLNYKCKHIKDTLGKRIQEIKPCTVYVHTVEHAEGFFFYCFMLDNSEYTVYI